LGSRRLFLLAALAAATVVFTTDAEAGWRTGIQPIRRGTGELTQPRLRAGTVTIPAGNARGRIRVIVRLSLPPLARHALQLNAAGAPRKLNVASSSSQAYMARLASAQAAAVAQLHRAIPQARVQERFRILLDGITVDLPAKSLPKLMKLSFANRIYPSVHYTVDSNRSPGVIAADKIWTSTGARGQGMKIGVVDDGVDPTNPYLSPAGFTNPPGFPRGEAKWETPKIIVAKAFPAPGAGAQAAQALYRAASFHGTHVSGIAAGDANTTAPAGADHPQVTGLSGVAPLAQIGNYRVFSRPTPSGFDAFTPEIVEAFEAVVSDGMDVLNFSGGGPAIDPANDGLVEAANNVAAAGVVPVISAGNDRDEFGLGSVGTPSTAPGAISVAAVSNEHMFAPALTVTSASAPANLRQVPFEGGGGQPAPAEWGSSDHVLVDPGTIVGTNGAPVDRFLCGAGPRVNDPLSTTLPSGSLQGAIALVFRGSCTFDSKARRARAAGAIGLIVVDNRPGEATIIPAILPIPAGSIADLDGVRLRDYLDSAGGRAPIRVGRATEEIVTGRSGVVMYFSSAGPSAFGHQIKPDLAAPGGQILSSTLPEYAGSPFAVFDGTSMAAPHVTGAAALLLELHPGWTPAQVKSALVTTAGPAWADTARTIEAPVALEGGGLINVAAANDPKLFTDPVSLAFDDLDLNHGPQLHSMLVQLTDASGGGGTWSVEVHPQTATTGASVTVPGTVDLPPSGLAFLPVAVSAEPGAATGDDAGFIVLRKGSDARRVPYMFSVTKPALESLPQTRLVKLQDGDTGAGVSHASTYRYPAGPYAQAFSSLTTPAHEDGAEKLYVFHLNDAAVNFGVSVLAQDGGVIDPFVLGAPNENTVQGYAGTPFDVNSFTFDFLAPVQAAATDFPRQKAYYVAVDSPRDSFTGALLSGKYVLNAWVNDVTPPAVQVLTRRVAAGRPTLAIRTVDLGSGVDPFSLVIAYRGVLLGAAFYDVGTGIALFPIPAQAPPIRVGKTPSTVVSYDFQETKNVDQAGDNVLPNSTYLPVTIRGVAGPAVSWVFPDVGACAPKKPRMVVLASSVRKVREVRFYDGGKLVATAKNGPAGIFGAAWNPKGPGLHKLTAVAIDVAGKKAGASRSARVCG
jgi:minor extracellular serine protease Vpr